MVRNQQVDIVANLRSEGVHMKVIPGQLSVQAAAVGEFKQIHRLARDGRWCHSADCIKVFSSCAVVGAVSSPECTREATTMPRNPPWNRDELILALDLYQRRGLLDDRDPEVIALSTVLNRLAGSGPQPDAVRFRNPNGVAMKLANLAALDPAYPGVALSRGGRRDAEVWDAFRGNANRLHQEAAALRARAASRDLTTRPRRYWAFAANPRVYRIRDAVASLAEDTWTTKGRDI
jgi:hypothetical protein